jgi:hypothetical protein
MTWRSAVPWALLGAAVVAAFTVVRSTPPAPPEPSAQPPDGPARPPVRAEPDAARDADAGAMTGAEWRDFHIHLAHEQCEEGARTLNRLEGRAETDPQVLTRLSVCLRIGNVAWYKCMLSATTAGDAHVCNKRFLSLDNPP